MGLVPLPSITQGISSALGILDVPSEARMVLPSDLEASSLSGGTLERCTKSHQHMANGLYNILVKIVVYIYVHCLILINNVYIYIHIYIIIIVILYYIIKWTVEWYTGHDNGAPHTAQQLRCWTRLLASTRLWKRWSSLNSTLKVLKWRRCFKNTDISVLKASMRTIFIHIPNILTHRQSHISYSTEG